MYKGDCSVKIFNLSNWTAIELLFLSFYVLKINAPVERLYRVFSVLNLYLRTLCIVGTVHVKQVVARLQCNAASRVIRLYNSFLFFGFTLCITKFSDRHCIELSMNNSQVCFCLGE